MWGTGGTSTPTSIMVQLSSRDEEILQIFSTADNLFLGADLTWLKIRTFSLTPNLMNSLLRSVTDITRAVLASEQHRTARTTFSVRTVRDNIFVSLCGGNQSQREAIAAQLRSKIWIRGKSQKLNVITVVGISPAHFSFDVLGIPISADETFATLVVRKLLLLPEEITLQMLRRTARDERISFIAGGFHQAFAPITEACSKGKAYIFPSPSGYDHLEFKFITCDRLAAQGPSPSYNVETHLARPGESTYSSVTRGGGSAAHASFRSPPPPSPVPPLVASGGGSAHASFRPPPPPSPISPPVTQFTALVVDESATDRVATLIGLAKANASLSTRDSSRSLLAVSGDPFADRLWGDSSVPVLYATAVNTSVEDNNLVGGGSRSMSFETDDNTVDKDSNVNVRVPDGEFLLGVSAVASRATQLTPRKRKRRIKSVPPRGKVN